MNNLQKLFCVMTLSLLALPVLGSSEQECFGDIDILPLPAETEHLQLGRSAVWMPVELRIPQALRSCLRAIVIGPENSQTWRLRNLHYDIRVTPHDAQRNQLTPLSDQSGWRLPLTHGEVQTVWLRLDNVGRVAPGNYEGIFETRHNTDSGGLEPLFIDNSQQIFVNVPSKVSLGFEVDGQVWESSSNSYMNLDLGEISSGSSKSFSLVLDSNTNVAVNVTTENRGHLVHVTDASSRIPYDVSVDYQWLNLASPAQVLLSATGGIGVDWLVPVQIRVPNVTSAARAGDYLDVLTFEVVPQN